MTCTGALLTWNQQPFEDPAVLSLYKRLQELDPDDVAYGDTVRLLEAQPLLLRAWQSFQEFCERELRTAANFSEISSCMELSLSAVLPRWHFHAALSARHLSEVGSPELLQLRPIRCRLNGYKVHVHRATGRGITASASVDRMHAYCQWPKTGSLFQTSNYKRNKFFVCKALWILSAWAMRKLSTDVARDEIVECRDRVTSSLARLTDHVELLVDADMQKKREACL